MASPSSAKIPVGSSTKQIRASKRDVGGRSRVIGASSVSNSSRRVNGSVANVNGGASGHGSGHSTRVYLDGVDVTPQSLLVSRIKPSTPSGGYDPKGKGKGGKGSRSKAVHGVGASVAGASMAGASMLFSHASSSSADNDSDSESSSSVVATGARGARKELRPSAGDHSVSSSATPTSNQEEDENSRYVAASNGPADPEDHEDGKDDGVDPLLANSGGAVDRAAPLLVSGKSTSVSTGLASARSRRVPVTVTLAETATEMLLEIRSVCVAQDAPYHAAVTARNKRYQAVCAQKKGSDKFVEGRAQTLQLAQKAKEVMTAPPATRDVACVATDWDIYDCGKMEDEINNETDEVGVSESVPSAEVQTQTQTTGTSSEGQPKDPSDATSAAGAASSGAEGTGAGGVGDVQLKQQVEEIVGATLASPGCVLDVDGDIVEDLRVRQHQASKPNRKSRDKHGQSNAFSQKSRMFDSQRSTVVTTAVSGNSNASVAIGDQSSGNVSAGASQDFAALTGGEASSGSAATNSQVGMSVANASRGVLSGGPGGGSGDAKSNNVYARANTNVDIGEIIARQRTSHVLGSSSLLLTANIVERAVQQNVYHQQHVRYRDFPTLEMVEAAPDPLVPALGMGFPTLSSDAASNGTKTTQELEQLWAFRCDLTKDRTVSCLAWNTANEDLLAVSYAQVGPLNPTELAGPTSPGPANGVAVGGPASVVPASPASRPGQNSQSAAAAAAAAGGAPGATGDSNNGLVLFWSLTNPEYPERIYHLPVGVTSIDFSTAHPYLLAVGFADGVVSIYDTRKADSAASGPSHSTPTSSVPGAAEDHSAKYVPVPIATSSGMSGKHLDAVWQVRWVARGGSESVVSVSSDGRVVEWSLKKGLSYSDLMTLKRSPNPLLGGAGTAATGSNAIGDGVISRQASGRCLAFASRGDPSVYFVGTEDGLVHKCSVSYNEQYLHTYIGHTGPVYQLLVSPFCSDLFLSCSGDWSLKLWHQADPRGDAVLTFHSVDLAQAVLGASWSPSDAAVFAAVAEDGRIELWDLAQSTLDPIVRHFPKKYIAVVAPVAPPTESDGLDATGSSREMTPKGEGDSDRLDDDTYRDPNAASSSLPAAPTMVEVPLECTTVAFAPKAPVLVVGDSTGDVTVYRVPVQVSGTATTFADSASDPASCVEEQAARLLRAIHPNKQE